MQKYDPSLMCEILVVMAILAAPIIGAVIGASQRQQSSLMDQKALLMVNGLCCEVVGQPAEAALMRVHGIWDVVPDYKNSLIHLRITSSPATSVSRIRDVLAATNVCPVRLDCANESYSFGPAK